MSRFLVALLVVSSCMADVARADTWRPVGRRTYTSPDGGLQAVITPPERGMRSCDGSDGTVVTTTEDGRPSTIRKKRPGACLRLNDGASGRELFVTDLPSAPGTAGVLDSGRGVVLLDHYGPGAGRSEAVLFVDSDGVLTVSTTMEDVFDAEVRSRFARSASSTWWRRDWWVDPARMSVVLVAAGPGEGARGLGGMGSASFFGGGAPEPPEGSAEARALARRRTRVVSLIDGSVGEVTRDLLHARLADADGDDRLVPLDLLTLLPRDPGTARMLATILRDDSASVAVRLRAAAALGPSEPAAVLLIQEQAATGEKGDATFALAHLPDFDGADCVDLLVAAATSGDRYAAAGARRGLVRAAGLHPELEPRWIELLAGENASTRAAAAEALRHSSSSNAVAPLAAALPGARSRVEVAHLAAALLLRADPGIDALLAALEAGTPHDLVAVAQLPEGLGERATVPLWTVLGRYTVPAHQATVLDAVARAVGASAAPRLADLIRGPDEWTGRMAVPALASLLPAAHDVVLQLLDEGTPRDLELLWVLERAESPELLEAVIAVATRIVDPGAAPEGPVPTVTSVVIQWLKDLGGPDAVPPLARIAAFEHQDVADRAVRALTRLGLPAADAALIDMARPGAPHLERIAKYFQHHRTPAAWPALSAAMDDITEVRGTPAATILWTLARAAREGDDVARSELARHATRPDAVGERAKRELDRVDRRRSR